MGPNLNRVLADRRARIDARYREMTSQRFSNDGTVFRMKKGGMATIKRAGRTSVDCQVR